MKIKIAGGINPVVVECEVHGPWLELGDRGRERLFTVIDAIKDIRDRAHDDYADEYK